MSPFSAIAVEDAVFWMGVDTFYVYAGGQTIQLPCTVKDKVFLDFNFAERDKVHVGLNSEFSEILWFYPSSAGTEIDKYVNYIGNRLLVFDANLQHQAMSVSRQCYRLRTCVVFKTWKRGFENAAGDRLDFYGKD